MVARGQGTSTVGSVPKTKTNTEKARTLDRASVDCLAATNNGIRVILCEKCHAR